MFAFPSENVVPLTPSSPGSASLVPGAGALQSHADSVVRFGDLCAFGVHLEGTHCVDVELVTLALRALQSLLPHGDVEAYFEVQVDVSERERAFVKRLQLDCDALYDSLAFLEMIGKVVLSPKERVRLAERMFSNFEAPKHRATIVAELARKVVAQGVARFGDRKDKKVGFFKQLSPQERHAQTARALQREDANQRLTMTVLYHSPAGKVVRLTVYNVTLGMTGADLLSHIRQQHSLRPDIKQMLLSVQDRDGSFVPLVRGRVLSASKLVKEECVLSMVPRVVDSLGVPVGRPRTKRSGSF